MGFAIVLFAIAVSLDGFIIGSIYGSQKIRISLRTLITILLVSASTLLISMGFGQLLNSFIPPGFSEASGGFALVAIGLFALLKLIQNHKNHTSPNIPRSTTLKDGLFLGIILSIDNLGVGFAASLSGFPMSYTVMLSVVLGGLLIMSGNWLGKKVSKHSSSFSFQIAAPMLLIFLGLLEIY